MGFVQPGGQGGRVGASCFVLWKEMVSLFIAHDTPSAWENSARRTGKAANQL